uniref:major capsid protein n=1 Tax=Megasphaera elsdenii TaxID=907 RepID=UPI00242C0DDE
NRKAKMAADILQTGKCDIEGYADDGKTVLIDTIAFDFDHKVTPTTTWDKAGATIYSDIKNASELIQEDAGIVPTMMICGKNIADYLLSNDQIMKWMMVPTADNLSLIGFQPQIISPQITHVGRIKSLNLDVYTYAETYTDDAGKSQYFIDPDTAIIAIPGRGSQLHGACTLLNDAGTAYETFVAPYVPYYNGNKDTQVLSFYMYCRCVLAPQFVDDWAVIKAK